MRQRASSSGIIELVVPGLGVEPRRARGPRDFKSPGKRQRTKGLANSLPFPLSEESEECRRVRGLWTPRWTPESALTSYLRAGHHRDRQPRLTARDGVARTPAESQPRFPENQRPARALGHR